MAERNNTAKFSPGLGKRPGMVRRIFASLAISAVLLCSGCSINNAKRSYVIAERLWTEGKYSAAVAEFEKVYARDPSGKLGLQALYRSATTQAYFLSQFNEAVKRLKIFAEANRSAPEGWEAQKLIGELLFSKMDQYDLAVQHYRMLIAANPVAPDVPEFWYRVAKGLFYVSDFEGATREYQALIKKFPHSPWAEKASYEIGVTYFTRGEQRTEGRITLNEAYQEAIDAYEVFLKKYPKSQWVPLAQFGIAACLEEMDMLDAAYHQYEALKGTYPSPKVVAIKLARIRERKAQRSH